MKLVYVPMVADCIHPGHLNIINIAAGLGEVMVGLFSDKAVASYKRIPYLNYEQRKLVVESIKGVSKVVKQDEKDYEPNLRKYRPDYMVHGTDWLEGPLRIVRDRAVQVMAEWGGKIVEPEYTKGVSSSDFHKDKNEIGITPSERVEKLGKLLDVKPLVRIAGIYDSLSAVIADKAYYVSKPGEPMISFDGVLVDASIGKDFSMNNTALLITINEVLDATNKPVLCNAGALTSPEQTKLMVKRLERLGVSAFIIEDMDDDHKFSDTISLCRKMRISENFMIMVKIKNSSEYSDKIKNKISAYSDMGIDGIILDNYRSGSEISTTLGNYSMSSDKKYMGIMAAEEFFLSGADIQKTGIKMVVYTDTLRHGAISGMENAATDLLQNSV